MRKWIAIFGAAGIVAATLPFLRHHDGAVADLLAKAKLLSRDGAEGGKRGGNVDPPALTDVDLASIDDRRDVAVAPAHGRRNAELTLVADYQRAAVSYLRNNGLYEGSIVMSDVKTGRIMAWANYNQGRPRDVASEATAPSASVFKIITGTALVEAGVPLNEKFCYAGGEHRVTLRDLEPDEKRDKYCATLPMALGRSLNTIFARQARAHLDGEKLLGAAQRYGYNLDIPFDVPVKKSTLEIPEEELEFARTAAGFWHSTLSPFQGNNIVLTLANGGEMIRSTIVARVLDEDGEEIYAAPEGRQVFKRVLDPRTAAAVTRMMEQTVRNGSGFKAFHDRAGRPYLPDIEVAGKTGTLAKADPSSLYTWFVAFAPSRAPEVALSVLVVNRGKWQVKAAELASRMLRIYFANKGAPGVTYPPGYQGTRRPTTPAPAAVAAQAAPTALPPDSDDGG
ncbi:MAG: penicillin-binding protein [Polyangiaceae bacterium]|nr:penicillin-binding protein [Polyangiaceae bacterium]